MPKRKYSGRNGRSTKRRRIARRRRIRRRSLGNKRIMRTAKKTMGAKDIGLPRLNKLLARNAPILFAPRTNNTGIRPYQYCTQKYVQIVNLGEYDAIQWTNEDTASSWNYIPATGTWESEEI